jgi:hypothetical protein
MEQYTTIIGDLHGCIEEAEEMIRLAPKGSRFVFAGDLVDRGPDSAGCVKLVRSLGDRARVVMGNHDHKHVRYHRKIAQAIEQGKPVPPHTKDEITQITAGLSAEDREWMAKFPYYVKLPGNVTVVHAGIPRDVTFLPPNDEIRGYNRRKRGKYEQLWFVRYIDSNTGRMVGNTFTQKPGLEPWSDLYDGYLGHVYYGHQPYRQAEPKRDVYATGIDLACVFGGWLCGIVVDESGEEVDVITIKAKAQYSDRYIER